MLTRHCAMSHIAVAVSLVYFPLAHSNALKHTDSDAQILLLGPTVTDVYHSDDEVLALSRLAGLTLLPADRSNNPASLSVRAANQGIAVLQDRVYFAPAPYSAPQLQPLPNILQQQSVRLLPMGEARLGGQGAFGVVNFDSFAMPTATSSTSRSRHGASSNQSGRVLLEGSSGSDMNVGVIWGMHENEFGMLVAANHAISQGDAEFINGSDAEQTSTDLLFKINATSLFGARNPQTTEFSYQYHNDDGFRSLLGLTNADWKAQPQHLYSASAADHDDASQHKYKLSHEVRLGRKDNVLTDFYYQHYSQQSAGLNQFSGAELTPQVLISLAEFERQSMAEGVELGSLLQNNDFSAFGAQSEAISQYGAHRVSYSARYHTDKAEMRMEQHQSVWQQDLSLNAIGTLPETAYTDEATALTTAIDSQLNWDLLQLKLALTYETVDVSREVDLAAADLQNVDFSDSSWLPAVGLALRLDDWRVSVEALQAWSAASAGNTEQSAQESLRYQLAAQYSAVGINAQFTAYWQDFDNLHVNCDAYSSCLDTRLWQQENIADVAIQGLEVSFDYQWQWGQMVMPLALNYQVLDAKYQQSRCTDIQGCVVAGDKLAWMPETQLQLSAGVQYDAVGVNANAFYQSTRQFNLVGAQNYSAAAQWRLDLTANYRISPEHEIYFRIENLLDESLIATAANSGIRTENGRISYLGYQWRI